MYFLGLKVEEGALDTFKKDSDCQSGGSNRTVSRYSGRSSGRSRRLDGL